MKLIYAAVVGMAIAAPAYAAERTIKTEYLACNPERQFDRAERYRTSGDTKALKEFTAGALLSRTCVSLKPGATASAEEIKAWDIDAAIPVIQGAGGLVTDWRGAPVGAHGGQVAIAGDRACLDEALAALRSAADERSA